MILTILLIALFLIASWFFLMNQKYKNFKRFLKPDDPVKFFIGEEKYYGRVKLVGRKYIHIVTDRLNGKPITRKIPFDNVYPVIWFRYKPQFD